MQFLQGNRHSWTLTKEAHFVTKSNIGDISYSNFGVRDITCYVKITTDSVRHGECAFFVLKARTIAQVSHEAKGAVLFLLRSQRI